jgi:NAD(P)-dependent dehydrogenase (short-subunit alcohol dehydrogenase family)
MRVLVTGAARGLGRAFVDALVAEGHSVVGADIAGGDGVIACDVSDPDSAEGAVAEAVEKLGGLDALVNNAGIVTVTRAPSPVIPVDEFDRVMNVNVRGTWLMTRAAIPALTEAGGGSIVNLASETAYSGSHGMTHYVASKAAVVGLTRSFARELGAAGIRVNAIAPGYTDTEGGRVIGDPATYDVSGTPLGRVATPHDMVGTMLWLIGPGSAFVSGQVVLVNGGRISG